MQTSAAPVSPARWPLQPARRVARALAVAFGLAVVAAASVAQPTALMDSGSYSGNYREVVILRHARVTLSGNIDRLVVEPGARLRFSGNAERVQVWGRADLTGTLGRVVVHHGGTAIVHGVAQELAGPGHIVAARGAVIGGVPVQ
jgi:hypothetical protein